MNSCIPSVQKDTIRDLNTGQLFALSDTPPSSTGGNGAAEKGHQFTDFASGKQLSLEEFDIALGIIQRVRACALAANANTIA